MTCKELMAAIVATGYGAIEFVDEADVFAFAASGFEDS